MTEQEENDVTRKATGYRSPRRGWQRVTVESRPPLRARDTLRSDAPSPSEEVIDLAEREATEAAVHEDEAAPKDEESTIICF